MTRKILFAIAGLAAVAMVSCTDDNTVDPTLCGNSVLDMGELCDGALGVPATCADFDSTKTWQAGGAPACGAKDTADACKILVGSCVEEGVVVVCGDGKKEGVEACDGADGVPATCAEFDGTKTWKTGGAPVCGAKDTADACKVLIGSCVEEDAVVACGNGVKEADEACDGADGVPVTCAEFDGTKIWQAGGAPACGAKDTADACKVLIGSCVEEGVVVVCGDGKKEGVEACDGSDGVPTTCEAYDPSKTWNTGGAPICGAKDTADACQILVGTCSEIVCGDGKKEGSEACDGTDGVPVTCADFDNTKTWQAGGAPACGAKGTPNACEIHIGSCLEVGVVVKCGDGKQEGSEVCDYGATQSRACSEINSTYESGSAKCEKDCSSINVSACVVKTFCGDGIVNNAEQCEPGVTSTMTCADFDKSKTWQAGGKPGCNAVKAANECKLNIGSCVEAIPEAVCGDGVQEGDEVCDYGKTGSKACKTINPKYVSGNAICESCKTVNESGCVEDTVMGLKWCQLMPPTQVLFTNLVSEFTVNALVHVTGVTDKTPGLDKVNAPKAIFTIGEDPNKLDEWYHVDATGDPATNHPFADNYTAKLTKADMLFLGPDVKQAYYSFGFAMHDSNDYKYCRRNMENEAVEDLTLKLINDKVDANVHIMGSAKVQDIAVDKMICEFTFDGLTGITKDSVIPANKGTCTIQALPNLRCEKTGCITKGIEQSWNVENYKKAMVDALAASHIILKASTTGASNIDLLLKMRRNNLTESPASVAVLYSLDGTTYVEAAILHLTTLEEEVKLLLDYKVQLPSAVNNQNLLHIKLAPFGAGNNAMRFDDIQISKR